MEPCDSVRQRFRLSRRETDISLLVEETVARFRNSTEKIAIRTDCPDAHVLFYADSEAFTKILSNLLANALKYARSTVVVVLRILDDTQCPAIVGVPTK